LSTYGRFLVVSKRLASGLPYPFLIEPYAVPSLSLSALTVLHLALDADAASNNWRVATGMSFPEPAFRLRQDVPPMPSLARLRVLAPSCCLVHRPAHPIAAAVPLCGLHGRRPRCTPMAAVYEFTLVSSCVFFGTTPSQNNPRLSLLPSDSLLRAHLQPERRRGRELLHVALSTGRSLDLSLVLESTCYFLVSLLNLTPPSILSRERRR
jgi:hypothetical protein